MDSSNAEKVYNRAYDHAFATGGKQSDWIKAGVQAVADWRDAEVAELTAANERLEAQIAKGGTIVQRAADLALTTPFSLQQATESLAWTTDVWHQFKKAEADRDAALQALAESRARFADSEARRAELEAVIEKGRAEIRTGIGTGQAYRIQQILSEPPSVVLEDRDREVAARALEDYARTSPDGPWVRDAAAAIRKGDTNA